MKTVTQTANVDKYGFPVNAPITQGTAPQSVVPWQWGMAQRIQTKKVRTSQVVIKSFVKLSNIAIGLGTVPSGGSAFLSTSLTPQSPHATDPNFANAYIGVFLGTQTVSYNTDQQLYPTVGTPGNVNKWDIRGDYDINGNRGGGAGTLAGTISFWNGVVINNSGATGTIQFVTQWRYVDFTNGTVV